MAARASIGRSLADRVGRRRLVDRAMETYVGWREAALAVNEAYAAWSGSPSARGAASFAAYSAALDQEECAASLYETVIQRVQRLLGGEREPDSATSAADRL